MRQRKARSGGGEEIRTRKRELEVFPIFKKRAVESAAGVQCGEKDPEEAAKARRRAGAEPVRHDPARPRAGGGCVKPPLGPKVPKPVQLRSTVRVSVVCVFLRALAIRYLAIRIWFNLISFHFLGTVHGSRTGSTAKQECGTVSRHRPGDLVTK